METLTEALGFVAATNLLLALLALAGDALEKRYGMEARRDFK